MAPGWVPETQELNDRIAEAALRAEQARVERRRQLRSWMPSLAEPFTPEPSIPFTTQQTQMEQQTEMESPETPSQDWQPSRFQETPGRQFAPSFGEEPQPAWRPQIVSQSPLPLPEVPKSTTTTTSGKDYALWEQPAEWAEQGQKLMAEGLSKVPLLPQGLAAIAPAFDWIHQNVEKPLASVLTTPFRGGKSYEEWEAPTYVKGLAEMPIWWIPWIGWAGKGLKVLGVAEKAGKVAAGAVKAAGKYGTMPVLPPDTLLQKVFKMDPGRFMAKSVERVPVLSNIVKAAAGPLAFVSSPGEYAYGFIKKRIVDTRLNRAQVYIGTNVALHENLINSVKPQTMATVLIHGDATRINKVLDITGKNGLVGAATPKPLGIFNDIDEVIKDPSNFTFATKEAGDAAQSIHEAYYGWYEAAKLEGAVEKLRVGRESIAGTLSDSALKNMADAKKITVAQLREDLADNLVEESVTGARHSLAQHHTSMTEGRAVGVQYSDNIFDYLNRNINYYADRIATERLSRNLHGLSQQGLTPEDLWDEIETVKGVQRRELLDQVGAAQYVRNAVHTLDTAKGTSVAGATMSKVREINPQIANRIESALVLKKDAIKYIVKALEDALNLTPAELKQVAKLGKPIEKIGFTKTEASGLAKGTVGKEAGLSGAEMMAKPTEVTANVKIISEINKAFATFGTKGTITLSDIQDAVRYINKVKQEELGKLTAVNEAVNATMRAGNKADLVGALTDKTLSMQDAVKAANAAQSARLQELLMGNKIEDTIIKEAYKQAFKRSGTELKTIKDELDATLTGMKSQLSPLNQQRSKFLKRFAEGQQALGEGRSIIRDIPAFRGRIFDTDIAQQLEKFYGPQGKSWVAGLAKVAGVGRTMVANLDLSMPFIQGLYVLGRSPRTWGKLVGKQVEYLIHPQNTAKYLVANANITREMGLYGSSFATFEYAQAAGALGKFAEKLGPPGKLYSSALKRTEAAFTGGGNVARVEMWKALKRPGMSPDELKQLSRTLDRMTGVMSMRELGISKRQSDYENAWLFFAPRYTRAGLSFVGDVVKGGVTGAEARTAIAALSAGGLSFYIGAAKAAGQQPNLDPSSAKFMTLKVGDSHVGIGGMLYSLARLQSNILATTPIPEMMAGVPEEKRKGWQPKNLLVPVVEGKLNRDNPFMQFLVSKTSPLTGTLLEAMEQKDYLGRPFETPADWAKFAAERFMPISAASMMEPGASPASVGVGLVGARAFPKSAWELRNEARDQIAQAQHGVPYADLNELQQIQLNQDPKLKALQAEADKQTEMRGGESTDSLNRRVERGQARAIFVDTMNRAQAKYDAGLMKGIEFKDLLQKGSYALAQSYKQIDKDPDYQKVIQRMNQGKATISDVGDVAYNTLSEASWSGKFDDEFGMFDYNAYQTFREGLRDQVGPASWDYVLDMEAQHRKDLPPLAQEYYKAREVLKPYWMVQTQVEKLFGKRFVESSHGQAIINRQKKTMRLSNGQVNKYIQLFYRD